MTTFVATVDHAEIVAQLLWDFNTEFNADTPTDEVFAHRFRYLLGRDDVLVLLAESAEEPAGFAMLTFRPTPYCDGPLAYLEELYVRPALRDAGIGTRLLPCAFADVRARGCCEVQIGVDAVDTDTRRFYERHGFSNLEPDTGTQMLLYLRAL